MQQQPEPGQDRPLDHQRRPYQASLSSSGSHLSRGEVERYSQNLAGKQHRDQRIEYRCAVRQGEPNRGRNYDPSQKTVANR